jgi:hypothetical protein
VIATALGAIAIGAGFNALGDTGAIMPSLALQAAISAMVAPIVFSMLAGSKRALGLPARAARE